jgi:hypothetical protein
LRLWLWLPAATPAFLCSTWQFTFLPSSQINLLQREQLETDREQLRSGFDALVSQQEQRAAEWEEAAAREEDALAARRREAEAQEARLAARTGELATLERRIAAAQQRLDGEADRLKAAMAALEEEGCALKVWLCPLPLPVPTRPFSLFLHPCPVLREASFPQVLPCPCPLLHRRHPCHHYLHTVGSGR